MTPEEQAAAEVRHMRQLKAFLSDEGLELLFGSAHSHNGWDGRPVSEATLALALDMAGMAPTAFNQQPLRVIFVRSAEAKARLAPAMSRGNLEKTMAAPVTAILCHDLEFWRHLPEMFPSTDAKAYYDGKPEAARESAFRNGTLQAAYFLIACRAVGLDCGPMAGFDKAKVADAFLEGRPWEVNFLMNIGHGDPDKVRARNPRLGFRRMAEFV